MALGPDQLEAMTLYLLARVASDYSSNGTDYRDADRLLRRTERSLVQALTPMVEPELMAILPYDPNGVFEMLLLG